MSLGRAVPWSSWEEWRQVGLWLLSGETAEVQRGLDRVAAWRVRGRVPLGVDSTACLVEAQQRDRAAAASTAAASQHLTGQARHPLQPPSESELRLQYAMAVVRMVNGIADSSQRGRVAASVASLASMAGLPRILVDLRHEATHNELPSLAALRLAAQHGLAWLQGNYWQRQSENVTASTDRIRSMEYLLLHQAAAAKVASTTAAADSEASEDEDGRPAAAAAAVAAAASVSAGRKAGRGGQQQGMPGGVSAAGDAGPGTSTISAGGGYQAADAKKRRRQLLAELRSAVPKPAAALLAGALLDASVQIAADGTSSDASEGPNGSGAGSAAAVAVAERALAAAMGHLTDLWPQLARLVLQTAVQRLAAAATAAAGGSEAGAGSCCGSSAVSLTSDLAWVRRLLPGPGVQQQQQQQQSVSADVLRRLLAAALPAHAAAVQQAALQSLRSSSSSSSSKSSQCNKAGEALQQAVAMLLGAARAIPAAASIAAAAGNLASLAASAAAVPQAAAAEADPAVQPGMAAQLAAAAAQQQALLQQLSAPALPKLASSKRGLPEPQGEAGGPLKRWRKAEGWRPCAVGLLPCPTDPNGQLPALDADTPLQLPAAFLHQQAIDAAAAAAHAAAAAGVGQGSRSQEQQQRQQQQQLERERRELLAEASLVLDGSPGAAPWPGVDRFALAAAAATGDAEAGSADGHCNTVRPALPHQGAALLL